MTKIKIGVTPSSFASSNPAPRKLLESTGLEVIDNPFGRRLTEEEAFEYLSDKDGLIAGLEPLTRKVLENAKSLKAIARVGIGLDNIDIAAANNLNIKISNTPDGPTDAVAELTVATAIFLSRRMVNINSEMHHGKWPKIIGKGLTGQKVLFIGYGRIGRKTAEMMSYFGAEILIFDPFIKSNNLSSNETMVTLDAGLQEADIISLHANGREVILGEDQFKIIKKGALLLNSARGELVDEQALIHALENGKIAGGWFDAFWVEPYKGSLLKYDNIILTPHVGTYTEQCRLSMEMDAVNNLLRDLNINTG